MEDQGDKVFFNLALRQLLANLVERFDGLHYQSAIHPFSPEFYLNQPFPEPKAPQSPPGSPTETGARARVPVLRHTL